MLYDPEANILCWEVAKGKIDHVREFGNFIIHLSKSGKPILIEILDASKFINQYEKVKNIKDMKNMRDIKKVVPVN
ncbi:DUF2283 domain-containing protein [Patescibacteria group bacterium]